MKASLEKIIKNNIFFFFTLLLIIPAILPLFHSGFFSMHDDQQVARLYELDRALAAGQFPARWVSNLGFGYGYPLFIFYPPLVYYIGEVFHLLLAITFIDSIKLVFAFAFLGSAFAMYLWTKKHFGKIPAIVAAAFYTYAPYHAVDAYVRGALAELTAFVWLPLILWSIDNLITYKKKQFWPITGLFLALLMLTHNLILLSFIPIFLLYSIFLILRTDNKIYALRSTLYAILLSAGLSAFFWLPALIEKKYTLVDTILLNELASYKLHFVFPSQLWNSLWGYGGSTSGPLDGISFKIGKLHVVISFISFVLWKIVAQIRGRKKSEKSNHITSVAFFLFLFSAFMATSYSQIIWNLITPLQYLQFPWRYLTFTALFASFLAASGIAATRKLVNSSLLNAISVLVVIFLLLYPNLKLFQPQTYLEVKDSYYTSNEFLKWKISKTSFEFVPKGIKTTTELNQIEGREITQLALTKDMIAQQPFKIISGKGQVKVKNITPGNIHLELENTETTTLQLSTFDFPGWEVKVDDKIIQHKSDNDLQLITFEVPKGNHTIHARFNDSSTRIFANGISIFSIIFLATRPNLLKRVKKLFQNK